MKLIRFKYFILIFTIIFSANTFSQSLNIDSCLLVLKTLKDDTNKVILLDKIAWDISYTNLQKGIDYSVQSYDLAKKIGYERYFAKIFNTQGAIYMDMAQREKAINLYLSGISYAKKHNLLSTESSIYNNIGVLYAGNNEKKSALQYYLKSLVITKKMGKDIGSNIALQNVASIYNDIGKLDSAFYYITQSINYNKEKNKLHSLGLNYNTLSSIYYNKKEFNLSLLYAEKAVSIDRQLKDPYTLTKHLITLSSAYYLDKNLDKCIEILKEALVTAEAVGNVSALESISKELTTIYEEKGDLKQSIFHYKKYVLYKDSILNEESIKKMKDAEASFEISKREQEIVLLKEKQTIADLENHKKKIYLISSLIGIACLGLVLFVLYRNNVNKQKANNKLKIYNKEIREQKDIIEVKNKEITDSINYAKRIQQSILTSDSFFKTHTKDYFILFKPKDIVSGDFYWAIEYLNKFIVMTADCTGHGVPGAMMSMMGVNFLNEIVVEKHISSPSVILNQLRTDIIKALNPEGSEIETKDGMDCSLCSFDFTNMKLTYSNANNSFYIIRDQKIITSYCNKMPVGAGHNASILFEEHTFDLQKDDLVITLTDGYADQFGGDKGKKFKYKKIEELLLQNAHLPLKDIKEKLNETIEFWRGKLEQVDDICVIGIKI